MPRRPTLTPPPAWCGHGRTGLPLETLTRITVSLPTQIVSYAQFTGGTATLQYNPDGALTDYTFTQNGYTRTNTYDEHGNITSDSTLGQTYVNTYGRGRQSADPPGLQPRPVLHRELHLR